MQLAEQIQEHRKNCTVCARGERCEAYRQAEAAQQPDKEATQPEEQQEPVPAIAHHQGETPPEQGKDPQNKTRSGRVIKPPDHLSYNKNFN